MKNQLFGLAAGMLMLVLLSVGSVAGATDFPELVVNGGFEAGTWSGAVGGDLPGWTPSGALYFTGVDNTPGYSLIGSNWFYAGGGPSYLSQTIATTPGTNYTISFWLTESSGGEVPDGAFQAFWGGTTLVDLLNPADFNYTNYSFTLQAVGSSADLTFAFFANSGYWGLDGVSVVDPPQVAPVPEPSTWLLFGSGLAGLVVWRYRTAKLAKA